MCEITIPHNVFEWFADVKRLADGKIVWTDWMEHYGSTNDKLDAEMAEIIIAFVDRVAGAELRLSDSQRHFSKHILVEYQVGEAWEPLHMC
jgi:hypothetical protein